MVGFRAEIEGQRIRCVKLRPLVTYVLMENPSLKEEIEFFF